MSEILRGATVSIDGRLRFTLERNGILDNDRAVLFVLNNPSIANAYVDDATARRGMGFARAWGMGRMLFGNTNPTRATDPRQAFVPTEGALRQNDDALKAMAAQAEIVIAAWGTYAVQHLAERAIWAMALPMGKPLQVLALTRNGIPMHILYLKGSLTPEPWMERAQDGRMRMASRAVGNL